MNPSLQHTLPHPLTFMFRDEDWFWKVSLGALALVLIPLGAGYFFTIGYLVETVRRCRLNETSLPDWNRLQILWHSGVRVGAALAAYSLVVCGAFAAGLHEAGIFSFLLGIVIVHAFAGPFVIIRYLERPSFRSCFDLRSLLRLVQSSGMRAFELAAYSFSIFVLVVCFGWMALIVGWPFFIFWGMLVSASYTASLAPDPVSGEAAQ